jgi:hypothetical protein
MYHVVAQAHAQMSGPLVRKTCVYPVPREVQAMMSQPATTVTFDFLDPTDVLARLLTMSPLAADRKNLTLFPRTTDEYDDFADGERLHRIQATLPPGSAALTSILFFDEINRDEKGFATGDGAIIVGGFFNKHARESSYAKASIGTFPDVAFPKVPPHHYGMSHFRC